MGPIVERGRFGSECVWTKTKASFGDSLLAFVLVDSDHIKYP